jgi:cyclophilin family peptidyl-prolyl cis-trans isomerase
VSLVFETTLGNFEVELFEKEAPISTQNFLEYVDDGFFDGVVFHRVIPGFMIQGGGFEPGMKQKKVKAPIKNEAANGLKNDTYTIAMARTGVRDSATAQFFINVKNNASLDYGVGGPGYAVFGTVIEGMDVVDRIVAVPTTSKGGHQDVPVTPVLIKKARVEAAAHAPAEGIEKPAPARPASMPRRN